MILIVDPYQYFPFSNLISFQGKKGVSEKINPVLWKLLQFQKKPTSNIILGDSRAGRFKSKFIRQVNGENYYNFSYSAGTLVEICNTFWWANKQIDLKKVYIGINFNLYNTNNLVDRVAGGIEILDNSLLYLTNRNVSTASYKLVKSALTGKKEKLGRPKMTEDTFWDYTLEKFSHRYYANYQYPKNMFSELQRISGFCRRNNIQLFFLVLPTHVSMQEKIAEYQLQDSYLRFISDLQVLGVVYDFNYPNDITKDRKNFRDPVHCRLKIMLPLIEQIWGGAVGPGRIYNNT